MELWYSKYKYLYIPATAADGIIIDFDYCQPLQVIAERNACRFNEVLEISPNRCPKIKLITVRRHYAYNFYIIRTLNPAIEL